MKEERNEIGKNESSENSNKTSNELSVRKEREERDI